MTELGAEAVQVVRRLGLHERQANLRKAQRRRELAAALLCGRAIERMQAAIVRAQSIVQPTEQGTLAQ